LTGARLDGARLDGARLTGARLTGARLANAWLSGAWLEGADFTGADLRGARMDGARLGENPSSLLHTGPVDSWHMYAVRWPDGPRILAGCRWFTVEEALNHWGPGCDDRRVHGDRMLKGVDALLGKARAKEKVRIAAANLKLLREAGVPIAFGNDAAFGFCVHGRPVDELAAMERAGLDRVEVLRAATSRAADLLGLADRGRIAAGKRADLVLLDPAAERSAAALERVHGVIAAGRPLERGPLRELAAAARGAAASLRGYVRTALTPLRGLPGPR